MKKKLLALLLVTLCLANLTACTLVEDLYWELSDRYDDYDDYDEDDYGDWEDNPEPEHVHTFSQNNGTPATCTTDGAAAQIICTECGYSEGGETIAALGHNWVTKPAVAATPTSVGYTAYECCTRCGAVEGREEVEFVCINHNFINNPAKIATPSQKGYTAYKKCSICGLEQGKNETVFTCPVVDLLPSVYDRLSIFNLTEADKKEICGMYDAVMTFQKSYTFQSYVTKEKLTLYYKLLVNAIPETMMACDEKYYYHYKNQGDKIISVTFTYYKTQQEYLDQMAAVEKAAKTLLAAVSGKSDFEKIKYFHDYLVNNCTYTLEGKNLDNAYGALVNGINHCAGFADAMSLLCNASGIKCQTVLGYIPEYHAWNILQLGGKYYYVDLVSDNVDWYGKPIYTVFGSSRSYIESINYVIEDWYSDIVPAAPSNLNISNRYLPTITAGQNVNTELTNIANETIAKKHKHIYIKCDTQEAYETAKSNVNTYVTKAIRNAYPGAEVQVMNKPSRQLVCVIVTYP